MSSVAHLIRGSLLISGTTLGGAVLALPILTGQIGFFPSILLYFCCWIFMTLTGLLFLEIALWMKPNANIITMAEKTLGGFGKAITWGLYLFLFYCLTLAYIVGVGDLLVEAFEGFIHLSSWQGQLLFLLLFSPFIYMGTHILNRLNFILIFGLIASYLIFVYLGAPHVNRSLLMNAHFSKLWTALPITFTAFAYQGIIPTLVTYMHRDAKLIRLTIIIGSFIPFVVYIIWQWLILGIIPVNGIDGLNHALEQGHNAVQPLKNILNIPDLYIVGQFFAFFALVISFLGVSLALKDFLADGLKIKQSPSGKLALCLLVFVPPTLFAFSHPHIFLIALDYAGGFGCALLLGLMPVLMIWRGRYQLGFKSSYSVIGGRYLLIFLILFVLIELVCQSFILLNS